MCSVFKLMLVHPYVIIIIITTIVHFFPMSFFMAISIHVT